MSLYISILQVYVDKSWTTIWDKLSCYWEYMGEQIKNLRNLMGTQKKTKKLPLTSPL
jgi:hypothetical protein